MGGGGGGGEGAEGGVSFAQDGISQNVLNTR